MMSVGRGSLKRLLAEVKILREDPEVKSYFRYESLRSDEKWGHSFIYGYILPRSEPFSNGSFKIRIRVPMEFPFKEPQIDLLTYMYHPRVPGDPSENHISCVCSCCTFGEWVPYRRISQSIKQFVDSIDQPILGTQICGGNNEILYVYHSDRVQYERTALIMVQKYACPREPTLSLQLAMKTIIRKILCNDSTKINQLPLPLNLKEYLNRSQERIK